MRPIHQLKHWIRKSIVQGKLIMIPAVMAGLLVHGSVIFLYLWSVGPGSWRIHPPVESVVLNGGLGLGVLVALLLIYRLNKPERQVAWVYDLFGGGLAALSAVYIATGFSEFVQMDGVPVLMQFFLPASLMLWNVIGAVLVLWGIIRLSRELLSEKDERRRLESLIDFTHTITSLDYTTTLNEAVRRLRRLLEADACILFLWDGPSQLLIPVAGEHNPHVYQAEYVMRVMNFKCPKGYGLTGMVMETGEPYISGDVMAEPLSQGIPGWKTEEKSSLLVPIQLENKRLGVVRITRSGIESFKRADLELAMSFGSQAGLVIEHVRMVKELKELSITDSLTGLYNARHFHTILEQEIARAERYGHPLSLVMMDSDSLKRLNDRYGHKAGDTHLIGIAAVFKEALRATDYAFRYAGDEFLLLLTNTTSSDALVVAERIRRQISSQEVAEDGFQGTVSVGIASYPENASNGESLLAAADAAMYRSKRVGKNRSTVAGTDIQKDHAQMRG